jgi:phage-related protein
MQATRSDLKSIMDNLPFLNQTEREQVLIALQELKQSDQLTNKAKITGLKGLGKEIWKDIDVDKYVRDLRDEWDDRKIR